MVFNGKSSDKKGSMENAHPSLLDSFGLGSGEVEVFPEGQQVTDSTGKTLAARDSLALQESGGVIKEEEHSDEFSVVDENSLDDDAISADSRGGSRRKILRIALLSALVLAIVLGTVLTRNKRGKSRYVEPGIVSGAQLDSNVAPTSLPSQSPTSVLESTMEYQLLAPYVNPPSKLLDPESPQGKAFTQILSEQTSEEFEFRVKQRFAMMVVFFAMGGEDWSWQKGWSDFSEDECDWHGVAICRFRDGHRIVAGLRLCKCIDSKKEPFIILF